MNDNKLKETILECTHIEGNIPLTAVTSTIKAYETNILISSKKPPENKAKKHEIEPETTQHPVNVLFVARLDIKKLNVPKSADTELERPQTRPLLELT